MLQRAEISDSHRMSPTRPETNAKSFVFWHVSRTSRWYLPNWVMSLHAEAPFVKNFTFFIFGFFPKPRYILDVVENHAHGLPRSPANKRLSSARKKPNFSGITIIISSSSSLVQAIRRCSEKDGILSVRHYFVWRGIFRFGLSLDTKLYAAPPQEL